ncbi:hypothetical protein [Burkholderia stagnalis]|uniref:hypothetical protein n=1 Tax=Burkholderia stagnalis TaxID=1503054 RepID=UPI000F5C0E11|nr:hypothetical protein [Burkholderia stagnalis]RQP98897.1 hypothetical protein DF164_31325 [Burkholderia stagnalis]RQY64949.1 hypothetical protein DF110_30855 [Burkholderia stagnalis]
MANLVKQETYTHKGQTFEIELHSDADNLAAYAFIVTTSGRIRISPVYAATLELAHDYYRQHQSRLSDFLISAARLDIEHELYVQVQDEADHQPIRFKPNLRGFA